MDAFDQKMVRITCRENVRTIIFGIYGSISPKIQLLINESLLTHVFTRIT